MVEVRGPLTGPVFGVDSKMIYKEWYNALNQRKEFRCMLGVVVNPTDNLRFDEDYDRILEDAFKKSATPRGRRVYSASDLATLISDDSRHFNFCLGVSRELMSLDYVKVTFVVTRMNTKWLEGGKVTVYGQYGTATEKISVPEFIDRLAPSYNALCSWKVSRITGVNRGLFLLDGMQDIRPSRAWQEFSSQQYPKILFRGDQTIPVISAADIILRYVHHLVIGRRGIIDENAVREIVLHDGKVDENNKFFLYLGNPDIEEIKPVNDSVVNLHSYIHHPIVYLSAGGIDGQSSIIEGSPLMDKILNFASSVYASVKVYNPKKDRAQIGKTGEKDFFVALNDLARHQLQSLKACQLNIEEMSFEQ